MRDQFTCMGGEPMHTALREKDRQYIWACAPTIKYYDKRSTFMLHFLLYSAHCTATDEEQYESLLFCCHP